MQCMIKREFEDENFMDSKVSKKSTALKTVAYNMVMLVIAILISTLEMSNNIMSCLAICSKPNAISPVSLV